MPLTPDQWATVKEIVASALELTADRRQQFVRTRCQGDDAVLLEAASLLEHAGDLSEASRPLKNRYSLLSELGRGGFAVTYLALDQDLHNRRVVVKMLSNANAEPYVYRKFEEEIRALSLLEHPNIINPLDCGRTEKGTPFLVMQFAEGETLRNLIRKGPISRQNIAAIVKQVGSALAFVHQNGMIHRDVKPENIIIQFFADGRLHVRLIDFGIASTTAPRGDTATRIVGSLRYMAPEQFHGQVGPASDVFAFGVLIYELLTGKPPFDSDNPLEIMEWQRTGRLTPPSKQVSELNPRVDSLLAAALSRESIRRPTDVSSFSREVADSLAQLHRSSSRADKKMFVSVGLAALLVATLVTVFEAYRSRSVLTQVPASRKTVEVEPIRPLSAAISPALQIRFERKNTSAEVPISREGILEMSFHDRFRLHVQSRSEGHFYVFSRSLESADLHILFPTPTTNQGRSLMAADGRLTIPSSNWFTFDETPGTETLILIWSTMPDPVFEDARKWANPTDRGAIPIGPAASRVLQMVAGSNLLRATDSEFQLPGKEEACGWLTLRHK